MLGCEANKEPTKRDNKSCDVSLFVSHPETASQWLLELNLRWQLQASAGPVSGDETNTDTHIHWLCDLTCMLSCAHNSCPFSGFPHIDLSALSLKSNSDINHVKSTQFHLVYSSWSSTPHLQWLSAPQWGWVQSLRTTAINKPVSRVISTAK